MKRMVLILAALAATTAVAEAADLKLFLLCREEGEGGAWRSKGAYDRGEECDRAATDHIRATGHHIQCSWRNPESPESMRGVILD